MSLTNGEISVTSEHGVGSVFRCTVWVGARVGAEVHLQRQQHGSIKGAAEELMLDRFPGVNVLSA